MSFYVADVFGYVMTGPPLVYQSLRVYRKLVYQNLRVYCIYSTLEDSDRQGEDRS